MTEQSPEKIARISATTVAAGDILAGKYRIDGQLGAGGMGVVLSATHLELDAPVAIKVVREEFARNEEVVGRMLFEARAVAKLRSSHVVRVLDVARLDSGAPYIVMERLEGKDLASLLTERGPLPVPDAVDYVLEACQCLNEAHALGIVHRDLKPENLFLAATREGNVIKVLDFGISKETGLSPGISPRSVMTSAGYAVGSPYYMSPEQMRAADVDVRADIWSLGAILYELLSGRCPFEGETLPVVCAAVLSDAAAPALAAVAPEVPLGLSDVVGCCLRKEREQRFDNVAELVAALAPFASAEGRRTVGRSSIQVSGSGFKLRSDRPSATPAPATAALPTVATVAAERRRWPMLVALGALVAVGAAWAALAGRTPQPLSDSPAAADAVGSRPTAPSPSPVETPPPPAPAEKPVTVPEPSVTTSKSTARVVKRPLPAAASVSALPVSPAPEKPVPPVHPTAKPSADPWDPSRLGGRY